MKSKITILLIFTLVSIASANVEVTVSCDYDFLNTYPNYYGCQYYISYTADANLPRGFALDIQVSSGTITSVHTFSTDYDIYPGSIVIEDGQIIDPGSPICDSSYPDTLGGIKTSGVTIEMASLYTQGETPPPASGILCYFRVSNPTADITVTENSIRGGVVMENPYENPDLSIEVIQCTNLCSTCLGDITGDNQVDLTDLTEMITIIGSTPPYIFIPPNPFAYACADMNDSGTIDLTDLTAIVNMLVEAGPPYVVPCPEN